MLFNGNSTRMASLVVSISMEMRKAKLSKQKKNRPKRNQPPLREATRIDEYLNRLGRGE
jgi:hypothetical protein